MGQYSMNAYDADIYLRQFKGLISNGNDPDGNLEYAVEAENVDTTDGFLQPAADPETKYISGEIFNRTIDEIFVDTGNNNPYWNAVFTGKTEQEINALVNQYYKFHTGSTAKIDSENYESHFRFVAKINFDVPNTRDEYFPVVVYLFACGRGLYVISHNGESERDIVTWPQRIVTNRPLDVEGKYDMEGVYDNTYKEGWQDEEETWPEKCDLDWSFSVYQSRPVKGTDPSEKPGPGPHQATGSSETYTYADTAIYMSCKERGLYCIQFAIRHGFSSAWDSFVIECYKIETPVNFEHIESFGERLWGCGSEEEKETLYYSTPYKAYDWSQNNDSPADGAGEIHEPNWDGDYFTGLRAFGNNLIAFKKHRAWKVSGVDIATTYITEQYGFGTEYPETVVSSGERLYMATRNGLAVYDGSTIRPMMQDNLRNLWSEIRQSAMGKMRAFLYENRKYCLAVPVDSDENNTLIVYDTIDNSVLFYRDMNIASFMHPILTQDSIVLWNGGRRSVLKEFNFNAWEKNLSGSSATKWMTPWIELGRKDIQKGGHDFYFTPEVKGENAVTFTISFQTEKKTKTKQYTVQPMTAAEIAAGKQGKTKRLHFGGTGRRFRIIIETPSGVDAGKAYKWRLYGGLHIISEIDKD